MSTNLTEITFGTLLEDFPSLSTWLDPELLSRSLLSSQKVTEQPVSRSRSLYSPLSPTVDGNLHSLLNAMQYLQH